ncbi:hypothetical protein Esi_0160_0005 [Ectocarpus siliculosus]|uniref:Uncharacterized protein n=1 Tax=Ectocarpus siliculosus TaxID=2880 RepID=D7FLQ6_ECTSI|nr:hypothetical protein Esi_0160_0005 [Ectocarpus siliculosus]|eukprot:CBJ29731.1 hypothetical protein Esi_0160_0005 [Ectocarpus siliculosus]
MSKERASSNLATSLASASASLNEANSSTSVPSTKRRKRGDVNAAKARVESGTPLERSDIDKITDVLANEYLKSMGLPTSGKVVDKRERLLQLFAKNKWMVYTPDAVDGGEGAARAAAAAPAPEVGQRVLTAAGGRPGAAVAAAMAAAAAKAAAAAADQGVLPPTPGGRSVGSVAVMAGAVQDGFPATAGGPGAGVAGGTARGALLATGGGPGAAAGANQQGLPAAGGGMRPPQNETRI